MVLYSPIQMAADLPENYAKYPKPFQFIEDVPVDWSDTRVLNGEVGDYVTIARKDRNSDDWYLGAITDEQPRTLHASLDFLDAGKRYYATIYRDGKDASFDGDGHSLEIETRPVSRNDTLQLQLAPGGGQAIRISTDPGRHGPRVLAQAISQEEATRVRRGMSMAQPPSATPQVSFWQIWNMCFGFLGIQFGFAAAELEREPHLPDARRRSMDDLPILWVAAPLTGLIVQPIIGYYSDRTWNWLGRRRPYFLAGALLASFALVAMPRSPVLWIAAGVLWVLDASINIAMEPFRAFVGDQLPERQRPAGYAMQSFFIGVGAVVAGMLPWIFAHAGVSNVGTGGGAAAIPDTVRYSFDIGAVVLAAAMLWTILTTREYPPAELHGVRRFRADSPQASRRAAQRTRRHAGALWFGVGIAGASTRVVLPAGARSSTSCVDCSASGARRC